MITVAIEIIRASWQVFYESAVYMLLGFFIAGILYVFIKPETIGRYLGGGKVRSVFLAALAGIPIPLCSCGVLPAAAGLKRQGADNGATLSFLISTPETGIDSIPLTYALMDPIIALIRPVAAFITAVVAGLLENFSTRRNNSSDDFSQFSCSDSTDCGCSSTVVNPDKPMEKSFTGKIVSGMKYAFVDLLGDIGGWFVLGILLAGMITYLIPDTLLESYLTKNIFAIPVMLIAGIPMYVCATASTPIAAALVLKGLNPGAALVFLLAGPATNAASMSVVSGLLGKRSLVIYLGSIVFCSILLGFFTDMLYKSLGVSAMAIAGKAADNTPHFIQMGSAVILGVLLLFGVCRRYSRSRTFLLGIRKKLTAI